MFLGSTLATTHPTLLDLTKRLDPNGKIDTIAEMLTQTNEILEDMVWVEGNLPTGHRTTVRTGLPTPTWRKLYGGVQPTKSRTAQVTDACGMLEAYAEVDKALADLNGNTAAFRLSEERAHIEGMNQEFASTLFYGNEGTEPEAFTGMAPRFNDQAAENGGNILTHAATPDNTDNTSIWLVVWGPNTVHGIYPKGSKAGIDMQDKGQVTIENIDGAGGRMEAYRSHYRWDCGLTVRDWRYVVRINFDLEDIGEITDSYTGPRLDQLMAKAMRRIPSLSMGRPAFYANRDALDALDVQFNSLKTLAYTTFEDAQGKLVNAFRKVPIRRCDSLLSTEAGI
ncbi:MAG: hypothetical protein DWQ11_18795 [Proteobacteria bacterium]|nr:MAG: hypothetical protein DWQ11_18795 [Pseudomonadota bacterium]